jgi:hypothetical protein
MLFQTPHLRWNDKIDVLKKKFLEKAFFQTSNGSSQAI